MKIAGSETATRISYIRSENQCVQSRRKEKSKMKHHPPTELTVVPRPLPDFLSKMAEMENRIARRAYELFASGGFTDGHDLDDWFRAESELFGQMPVKVTETDNTITVKAALPGFTEKDVEVRVEPRCLFINATHEEKSEDKKKGYSESSSELFRAVALPADVDPDKVKATLSKGELEVTLPKREIGKKILVQGKAA